MRTIFLTLLLLITLTACAGKDDTPADPSAEPAATEETTTEAASDEATTAEAPAEEKSVIDPEMQIGPIGEVRLADGSVIELAEFEKIGKYFIYISGKLNGRSSTVISLTRLSDLKRWKTFIFKDQHTFTIVTRTDNELQFADSRIYIGSDSPDTYTFYTSNPNNFQTEKIEVKKKDVTSITIN